MSDRQTLTPPQTTMWPSSPRLSLSISSAVSPAAMVVLAQSVVFRVREKTTFRPGRHRESVLHDGRWYDDVLMSILAHEWAARRSSAQ